MSLPVPIPMALAIYFVMWWMVLFAVLPFGIRSQQESGAVVPGSEPGAPATPRMLQKALWTTIASAVLFVALMGLMMAFPDA